MKLNLKTKLTLAFTILFTLISVLIILVFYDRAHETVRDRIRSQLIGIASTGALLIDPELISQVRTRDDENSGAYKEMRRILLRIKNSNPKITYVYLMRKSSRPSFFEFIVDPEIEIDRNQNGVLDPQETIGHTGELFDTSDAPEMQKAFERPAADKHLNSDKWGVWLSGYAPILDEKHEPVAMIGVDMAAEEVVKTEKVITTMAILSISGTLILSLFVASMLSAHFTKPLEKLIERTRMVSKGIIPERVEIRRYDELGILAEDFNQMIESLKRYREFVQKSKEELENKVAERTRQLMDANKVITQASKLAMVGQLAAGVAHEINNPLSVLSGDLQLLLDRTRKDDQIRPKLERMNSLTLRIAEVVRNLLIYSRQLRPDSEEPIDIHRALDESLNILMSRINQQGVKVERQFDSNIPLVVKADLRNMIQVFTNIITNALDAMTQGGTLSITTKFPKGDGVLEIVLSDNGTGMSERDLERVFEPFFTTKDVGKGVGLGLSISQSIVRGMSGDISVTSTEGKGTNVAIRIPFPGQNGA